MNNIPPIHSRFQLKYNISKIAKTGRLCINKPNNILPKGAFSSKTSKEKSVRKRAKTMHNILGVQNSNDLAVIFILLLQV